VPADVKVTSSAAGHTTTIKTAKVTFGPDPPKASIAGTPTTKGATVTFSLRCKGLSTQFCRGAVQITTFEKLSADGHKITGLAYGPSGKGNQVTIANTGCDVRTGNTIKLIVNLNATGKSLLSKFGRIPTTMNITPTHNGYALAALMAKVIFKR
jgi:hypothetical protein